MEQNPIPFLEGKEIRYVIFEGEKWFSVVDIIEVLTESTNPLAYWVIFKNQLLKEYNGIPFWNRLEMQSKDGKMRDTDCANTEGVLRIVMSIPSPKAEPLKLWFAEQAMNRNEKS
jgi:DNA-damage-inducible protein D